MVLLREQILGKERFDWAFRKYISDWAFKHPSPSDFFREMGSEGGEDLGWFWRGWYMKNWRFDLAVTKIDGDQVTFANKGQLVLPATVEVRYTDAVSYTHLDVYKRQESSRHTRAGWQRRQMDTLKSAG